MARFERHSIGIFSSPNCRLDRISQHATPSLAARRQGRLLLNGPSDVLFARAQGSRGCEQRGLLNPPWHEHLRRLTDG